MNLNPKGCPVKDNLFEVKDRLQDALKEPILFEPIRQRRVSHAKVFFILPSHELC